jgi:hypothetical protein
MTVSMCSSYTPVSGTFRTFWILRMAAGSFVSGMASSFFNQPYALKKLWTFLDCLFLSTRKGWDVRVGVGAALGMMDVPLATTSLMGLETQKPMSPARSVTRIPFIVSKKKLALNWWSDVRIPKPYCSRVVKEPDACNMRVRLILHQTISAHEISCATAEGRRSNQYNNYLFEPGSADVCTEGACCCTRSDIVSYTRLI